MLGYKGILFTGMSLSYYVQFLTGWDRKKGYLSNIYSILMKFTT